MLGAHSSPQSRRFGLFEVDLVAREVRKKGVRLKLQQQPFELLVVLLENPGQVVSREELRQKLWPTDVYVDFDRSLTKAMVKLREALGDSSDSPLYVETLPRVGYRFIGMLNGAAEAPSSATGSFRPPEYSSAPDSPAPPAESSAGSATIPAAPPARTWRKHSRLLVLTAAAFLLIAAASAVWAVRRPRVSSQSVHSLAVLPLDNLSGDPAQDYFADGMTDELTTMLAKYSTLNVISRTSVMQYKGAHRPLPEIARELGVDGILEGSVSRSGDNVHMTIQLINAPTNSHLWAESYDRNTHDSVSLPSQAAQSIAKRLNAAVLHPPNTRYVDPEAHDAYLRGRYLWYKGGNEEAGRYFRKATDLQPDYALGWTGLADYYGQGINSGEIEPRDARAPFKSAALRAVQLDDSLPGAHLSLGAAYLVADWDLDRAQQELRRSIELDPKFAPGHHFYSKVLAVLNQPQQAVAEQKLAMELDPFARPYGMGHLYTMVRQCDAAIQDLQQRLQSAPDSADLHWFLGEAYRCKHMNKEAVQVWLKAVTLWGWPEAAAKMRQAYEHGGYPGLMRWRINDLKKKTAKSYTSPWQLATFYAELGEREEAIRLLQQAYQDHSGELPWLQTDTAFDFLHADDRYRAIVKGIGLPPAY